MALWLFQMVERCKERYDEKRRYLNHSCWIRFPCICMSSWFGTFLMILTWNRSFQLEGLQRSRIAVSEIYYTCLFHFSGFLLKEPDWTPISLWLYLPRKSRFIIPRSQCTYVSGSLCTWHRRRNPNVIYSTTIFRMLSFARQLPRFHLVNVDGKIAVL